MTRSEKKAGDAGQQIAASVLRSLGVNMVEQIATPVHLIPHHSARGYFRVIYGEPVSGDFRGVMVGGRSVLVEVKTVEHNLRWSDFREHQPERLTQHAELGGLSLVVWVHSGSVYVMRWPLPDFGPRKSIGAEYAAKYDEETREELGMPY